MFLETLWVKTKLKLAWPRAGLEIPSIFCSTHGPRSALVVVPAVIVCQGQAKLMLGRCALMPTRCSAADSVVTATEAIARRKMSPSTSRKAAHLIFGEMRRRRGPEPPPGPYPGTVRSAGPECHGASGPG